MTAADEYQRVARAAITTYWYAPEGGQTERAPAEHLDLMAAHVAQALAADPRVRAAVDRAAQAIAEIGVPSVDDYAEGVNGGLATALNVVRDLMPRKDGE